MKIEISDFKKIPNSPLESSLFIGGKDIETKSFITRYSPAHLKPVSKISEGTKENVDYATSIAKKTFENSSWSKMTSKDRSYLFIKLSELIKKNYETIGYLDSIESGKPYLQAKDEVLGSVDHWHWVGGVLRTISGETYNHLGENKLGLTLREPIGVVGIITPWNFPFLIASEELPYALASGNTAIIKPSEFTSSSTIFLSKLMKEAGFPDGVVNVVTGYGNTVGTAIVDNQDIRMISFTGSTKVGKIIVEGSAKNLKKTKLELGGKNPMVVFGDSNLNEAADAAAKATFFNSGECCVSGSRILVEKKISEEFVQRVLEKTKKIIVGDPLDEKTTIGPMINESQYEKVQNYINIGKKESTLRCGGTANNNLFIDPTVFDNVKNGAKIATDEIFGPVMSVIPFNNYDDAIKISNDTDYGLSAGVFTNDFSKALNFSKQVKAGSVWINTFLEPRPEMPFGGYKSSGLGRKFGIEEYTEKKAVTFHIGKRTDWWLK